MILGLGTDIVEISRIEEALARTPRLSKRVLQPVELEAFEAASDPARFLAKRFAAKEAAVKALGTGIGHGVGWQQLRIEHDPRGKPLLVVEGHAAEIAAEMGIEHWLLSYSDERHYVVATVVAGR